MLIDSPMARRRAHAVLPIPMACLLSLACAPVLMTGCETTEQKAGRSRPIDALAAQAEPLNAAPEPVAAPVAAASTEVVPATKLPQDGFSDTFAVFGDDLAYYTQQVMTLSDPYFEGRAPDTRGNRIAAEYIEFHFRKLGLQPAFPASEATLPPESEAEASEESAAGEDAEAQPEASEQGTTVTNGHTEEAKAQVDTTPVSYQQAFTVRGGLSVEVAEASFSVGGEQTVLEAGKDFNAMGFAGNAAATAPLTFVGYSIEEGEAGYSSYKEGDSLEGRIAVLLRFEPMGETGKSKWSDAGRWSRRAGLSQKVQAAIERGAAGIILVNPPGADDPRVEFLETHESTRFGEALKVPAIMLSLEAGEKLLKAADPEGRSLLDLRKLADEGGSGAIPLKDDVTVTMNTRLVRQQVPTSNVGAILPGRGELAKQYVIIGGHFDHVGYGRSGSRGGPSANGKIHPGADDNASGTAGVLLAAKILSERYAALPEGAPARTILFLAFSGEEMGLLGSRHFTQVTSISADDVTAMLNMDMIGRLRDGKLTVYGLGTAKEWAEVLDPLFASSGFDVERINAGIGPSDHASFYRAGVPVLHFFTGLHPEYHMPTDVARLINYAGGVQVVGLLCDVAMALATRSDRLTLIESAGGSAASGSRPQAPVRLGIAPGDYSGDQPGVLVGEVYENTSAADAGIRAGDLIIRWGGEELPDAGAMMRRLREHQPGDIVEVVVVRDGQEMPLRVTLKAPEQRP